MAVKSGLRRTIFIHAGVQLALAIFGNNMFWIWMILEVVWTVCESSVESFLKSNEAVSPEIAKESLNK